ncbi:uncharacterized protein [Eurosta solidaginis]|uniref:uncharacterized protein n=1 Tax=Eurosta solidaginis TaxID=178769 RepID=UPI003530C632
MCNNPLSNNLECGRVYIHKSEQIEFRIVCILCRSEFTTWQLFTSHIYLTHESNSSCKFNLEQKSVLENEPEIATDQEHLTLNATAESVVEFLYEEVVTDPTNEDIDEKIVSLVVEILPSLTDRDNEEMDFYTFNDRTVCDSVREIKGNSSQTKTTNSAKRSFFQLRTTAPSVILGFIDIIRCHSCQWNPADIDYGHKKRRDESLIKICEELRELFKICISPQLARSSIRTLIRWFDREYLRSVHLHKSNVLSQRGRRSDGYNCAHPKYFDKLFAFLPYKHLGLVSCEICLSTFKTENQLKVHNHYYHGGDVPFNCRYCKRSFLHASTWKHHENRHTKTRIWRCSLCKYISTTKTDYNLHMVRHSDTRAYICDLCVASYKTSTSLHVHFRTHDAPKLQCKICYKKFYENYRLKRHLMVHEAEESVLQCDGTIKTAG